jgi:hypothetical protein
MNNPTRTPHISGKNILCLAIDRLNADFLGAYGNAWVETPAFDALAAESVLFDSFFATSLDLETLYRAFWHGESPARVLASADEETNEDGETLNAAESGDLPPSSVAPPSIFRLLKEKGYRTFVVSDDETVALHPAVEDEFCDGRFFLGSPDAALPAETLEETQFFRNFEELARFLAKLEDDAKCADGGDAAPWFVWRTFPVGTNVGTSRSNCASVSKRTRTTRRLTRRRSPLIGRSKRTRNRRNEAPAPTKTPSSKTL